MGPPDLVTEHGRDGDMDSWATFSPTRLYRYRLGRQWDDARPLMVWLMLNPSTADVEKLDPTVRRCVSFAKRDGAGGIEVLNLYALRATDPRELLADPHPEGNMNPSVWSAVLSRVDRFPVVAAWGAHADGLRLPRSRALMVWLAASAMRPLCLGTTRWGHPRHPLYVRSDAPLVLFGGIHG